MSEVTNTEAETTEPVGDEQVTEEVAGQITEVVEGEVRMTFTQEEFDTKLQSEVDRRVLQARDKIAEKTRAELKICADTLKEKEDALTTINALDSGGGRDRNKEQK